MSIAIVLSFLTLTASSPTRAAQADDSRVTAHLAAGEFSLARRAAEAIPNATQRDRHLIAVADAQRRAGASRPAVETLSRLSDDRARLAQMGGGGFFGGRFFGGGNVVGGGNPPPPDGGQGGGTAVDFDPITELITSTVAPPSWDAAGGTGSIRGFANGVIVDAQGLLKKVGTRTRDTDLAAARLAAARLAEADSAAKARGGIRSISPLRKISLTRLEKQVQARTALGREPTEAMRYLAGIHKIKYVFVYPDSRDIVLAGLAGDWTTDREDRVVNRESGRPVLHLDDLVLCLRHAGKESEGGFGCSINPTQTGLARTQAFLTESAKTKLDPSRRDAWLARIRESLGRQEIEVFGVAPRTRAAQVMVEADYHMKLVGLGLEEGVLGVTNYLELLAGASDQANLDVLRWWFTLDYRAIQTTAARDAFLISGPSVKVQSENERLTEEGRRVATGETKGPNERFARTFTEHLAELAQKHPVYAELQNVCDLALVAALLKAERVADRVGWRPTSFGNDGDYEIAARREAPKEVESVVAHRVVNRSRIVAAVSGGVRVDPARYVKKSAVEVDRYGRLAADRAACQPTASDPDAWWWD
jgi:hypothetical protein